MGQVYQVIKDNKTLWGTTDSLDSLKAFCQYLVNSVSPEERLNDFKILAHGDEKYEILFPYFCAKHRIKKQSFEERMGV